MFLVSYFDYDDGWVPWCYTEDEEEAKAFCKNWGGSYEKITTLEEVERKLSKEFEDEVAFWTAKPACIDCEVRDLPVCRPDCPAK